MIDHILIIDDDLEIRALLAQYLKKNGFVVSAAKNSLEADQLLRLFVFDAVVLDVMMPGESGIEFLKRNNILPPTILLTALGDVDDRISGLESGAEDYMAKPFEPKELMLRIRKLIKRSRNPQIVKFGKYQFNILQKTLFKGQKKIHLTYTEQVLMHMFVSNIGIVLSRSDIKKNITNINQRSIDTQITRLRNKIEENPKNPEHIQTVRNKGYILWG